MEAMSVATLKTHFSEVIENVKGGEEVEILYGRAKVPVAKIVPIYQAPKKDLLGALQGKVKFEVADDWKMTPEELINL
jgi:antitoxin (DNA-binding transcriptional repressor) of toxin-antitoxin stability system